VNLTWQRDEQPVWDADKARVIGGAPEGAFVIPFHEGDALPGEWFVARAGDRVVGHITSAVYSPAKARVIALAYVQRDQAEIGNAMALAGGDAAVADGFC